MRTALFVLLAAGGLAAAAPAAQPAAAGCQIALRAEAETASFAAAGRNATPARTAQLARTTGTAFNAAASRLCAAGELPRAQLARFSRLLVRNAEGASAPTIYDDAEEHPGVLIIEFAFTDGGAPGQAAVETAIRCWRDPQRAGCGEEDVGP